MERREGKLVADSPGESYASYKVEYKNLTIDITDDVRRLLAQQRERLLAEEREKRSRIDDWRLKRYQKVLEIVAVDCNHPIIG